MIWACGLVSLAVDGEAVELIEHRSVRPGGELRGAAFRNQTLFTWGNQLSAWTVPQLRRKDLRSGDFQEGGCLVDLDGDGRLEWAGQRGKGLGELVWMRPPRWRPEQVDSEIDMHDCIEAKLFGRVGILMVNRHMQMRFYHRSGATRQWRYREIYSFYTGSQQSGLALTDVDSDGRTDILCGNYWIKSPESFDLPWRLFAINTQHETPLSAMSRFGLLRGGDVWVTQSHMERAKLALYRKPRDPKQLWQAVPRGDRMELGRLHALAMGPWDGEAGERAFAGEHRGSESRLLWLRPDREPEIVAKGRDFLEAFVVRAGMLLTVGVDNVTLWGRANRQ